MSNPLLDMTALELFDHLAAKLLAQGVQSRKADGLRTCLYRGPNGLMCGAGPAIPDDQYDPRMEEKGVNSISRVNREFGLGYSEEQVYAMTQLQHVHDLYFPDEWPEQMGSARKRVSANLLV